MKYKIKNHIIDAKSPVEALKIHKLLDSVKDSLTREERELVDYCIDNIDHRDDANRLIELMRVYYSAYSDLARRKPNEIKEYFREVIGDSCKDSVKDAEPTYRSVWLKVKEYVKSHYNFKYSRDFSGLMNWLNTQYGGILDEDEVYKILRDLNSKGYVMFITDSQEELDYLTEEEERAVDDYRQAIENTTNPKLLKLYQHILEEELEHIEELTSAEVVEDSHTSEELLAVSKELMKNKMVITQSESIAKEYAKNKNPYHKYKVTKVSNGYKIEVVDSCKTKDMRLPDYKETAIYLHSLSKHITQMSRSEEFSKQEAVKFVNDVEREANSIINKAKQEINSLTWIK
jgi:hypothetical protein